MGECAVCDVRDRPRLTAFYQASTSLPRQRCVAVHPASDLQTVITPRVGKGRGADGRSWPASCPSRRPPIRGHTSPVPRHGLLGVGSLKQ